MLLANLQSGIKTSPQTSGQGPPGGGISPAEELVQGGAQPSDVVLFSTLFGAHLQSGETTPDGLLGAAASSLSSSSLVPATALSALSSVLPHGNELPLPGLNLLPVAGLEPDVTATGPRPESGPVVKTAGSEGAASAVSTLLTEFDPPVSSRAEFRAPGEVANVEQILETPVRERPSAGSKPSGPLVNLTALNSFSALAQSATPVSPGVVVHELPVSASAPQFREAFANRIVWMVKDGVQSASLRLNPPQLGAVSVHISLNQSEALVSFAVQSEPARDAIEQALPHLKTLMEQSGLKLGDAQVSAEHPQSDGKGSDQIHPDGSRDAPDESPPTVSGPGARRLTLIDQYV